jgi:hypothetical protein
MFSIFVTNFIQQQLQRHFRELQLPQESMALNFNTTALAVGVWTPTKWAVIAGGVLGQQRANNLATRL